MWFELPFSRFRALLLYCTLSHSLWHQDSDGWSYYEDVPGKPGWVTCDAVVSFKQTLFTTAAPVLLSSKW